MVTALHTSSKVDSKGTSCDFSSALHTSNLHQHSCVSLHFRHTSETAHLSRDHPHHNDKPGMPFFLPCSTQRGRENEAVVTLNRGRDMPQLGLRKSQARGHPKAQPPSHLGAVEINPTCVHAAALMTFYLTTCKYSRESATSRESFAAWPAQGHLQDSCAFLCPPSLFFKPSWRCLPSPSHALAGMLNADETILDPSSSTYFRAINLAS